VCSSDLYESNREVLPVGAEVAEFVAEPEPVPPEPPRTDPDADHAAAPSDDVKTD